MSRRWLRRTRPQAPGTGLAVVGTAAVHLVAAVALFSAPVLARRTQPPVYTVQLVAAPAPEPQQQRRAPEVVQRPAERTVPTQPPPRRTSVAKTPPPPTRQPETPREPAPRTNPAEPLPDVKPSTGTDPATVKTAGVDFPYPEYLRNIVAQVYRQWTRPSGNVSLRAEVLFFVHRDGSISNFQFVRRSGNFAFDLEAQGAIEAAAAYFGPLPAGYPADVLPVSFFFDPATIR